MEKKKKIILALVIVGWLAMLVIPYLYLKTLHYSAIGDLLFKIAMVLVAVIDIYAIIYFFFLSKKNKS